MPTKKIVKKGESKKNVKEVSVKSIKGDAKMKNEKVTTEERKQTKQQKEDQIALQTLRGMRDILPGDQPYWEQVRQILAKSAQEYGFGRIDTPIVEFEHLFVRSVGKSTEVVEKEMYSFTTRGGDNVALRPEHTAGNVRAYIQHGMNVWRKPVRLFSVGPVYRYDRPQEGRYRELFQANFEIYGEKDPIIDAQIIQSAARVLKRLGIKNISFSINSIGTSESRSEYKKKLTKYLEKFRQKIPANMRRYIKESPFRILDAKDDICREIVKDAPRAVDSLDQESQDHFSALLEYLDELKIPYEKDETLVRGLDYYTQTVFEIYTSGKNGKRYALGGGGRYDTLIGSLGGEETPAIGFAFGLDRLVLEMKRNNAKAYELQQPRVFLAQLGELAKKKSLSVFARLQNAGILTAESFGRGNLRSQLRKAERSGVDIALIIGQKEALDSTIIIKDMLSGSQETIAQDKMIASVRKTLKNIVSGT